MTPSVASIHIAPGRRLPTRSVPSVEAQAGLGLVGDRYHGSRHRHVTLQALDALEAAATELGRPVDPGLTRRNITITGAQVPTSPGTPVTIGRVRLVSLGDYVLNGGEVAAMAMIEAVGRLVPGVVGNPESLVEESHEDGLLEYPSYTKPASWRGYDVPDVLLSGHHGRVVQWRRDQQVERTRLRRPDLLSE